MNKLGVIVVTSEFQVGDKICHVNNYNAGWINFFEATDSDVETYSGKGGNYVKIIEVRNCEFITKNK